MEASRSSSRKPWLQALAGGVPTLLSRAGPNHLVTRARDGQGAWAGPATRGALASRDPSPSLLHQGKLTLKGVTTIPQAMTTEMIWGACHPGWVLFQGSQVSQPWAPGLKVGTASWDVCWTGARARPTPSSTCGPPPTLPATVHPAPRWGATPAEMASG